MTVPGAAIEVAADAAMDLQAPTSGTMAGLLFFASRDGAKAQHSILSEQAQRLTGTIYVLTGELRVDGRLPSARRQPRRRASRGRCNGSVGRRSYSIPITSRRTCRFRLS